MQPLSKCEYNSIIPKEGGNIMDTILLTVINLKERAIETNADASVIEIIEDVITTLENELV